MGIGDVTVDVQWSTVNYKDALAITGRAPVVRNFPMIAGIDFSGVVIGSDSPNFKLGEAVVLNGWGHGETLPGGLAARARVPASHLVHIPAPLTPRQAMSIGTAGYTAALCVQALEGAGITPERGDVLVTGANGGVGGFAIALLARRGFRVVAATGRLQERARLEALGAARVIDREELSAPGKPLQKERWAGVVDSVGSHTLANACAQTCYGGAVAACGLAQGMDFSTTVAPFILRGVRLLGVDSVMAPTNVRRAAWQRLATDLDDTVINTMISEIPLEVVADAAPKILAGQIKGRLLVRIGQD